MGFEEKSNGRVEPRPDKAASSRRTPSLLLVGLQFGFIGALLLSGPLFARRWYWLGLELAGIGIVLWAVAAMRVRQLRISPTVGRNAQLVERGPYRWVRHPMYTGSLVTMLGLVLDAFTLARLGLWLGLVASLLIKARFEEGLLRERFPSYAEYMRRTKRLLPYLFAVLLAPALAAQEPYRVIMWTAETAYKDPAKRELFWQRLREMGVNTAMVTGQHDPQPVWESGMPYYVENIVNRGLCLKWNSKVRDWSKHVDDWKKTRSSAAFEREYCLDDPHWQAMACDQIRAVARRHKERQPVAYDIRDEISITISANPFDYCFCPKTLAAFRAWLKTQYRDLDALNRQWDTSFASWDQVRPFTTDQIKARLSGESNQPNWQALRRLDLDNMTGPRWNLAPWCDFRTYMDLSLANALDQIRQAAHQIDPRTPVGIEGTQMPHAFGGYDLARLARVLDWVEPYDIAGARAIFGSFMPGRPIYSTCGLADTNAARRRLWHLLLEGDRGCIVWWSEDCLDWKNPELPLTPKGQALAPVFRELTGPVAALFLRAEREFDPIAIHYSQPSIQVAWQLESLEDGASWIRRFSSYEARHSALAAARVRCLQQLRAAGFSPRFATNPPPGQVFLMVGSRAMSATELEQVGATRAFADVPIGLFDEHGTLRTGPRPTVPLVTNWTEAVSHLNPAVRVSPAAAVYRYKLGQARLLAIESATLEQMGEDLKVTGRPAPTPVLTQAQLPQPSHVYDLRTLRYLGHTDRLSFELDPDQPALFALTPTRVPPQDLLQTLQRR